MPYKDPDVRRAYKALYERRRYSTDPVYREQHRVASKRYHAENKAIGVAVSANKQAKKIGVPGKLTVADVRALWERQPACLNCGRGRGLDHIIAMVNGGPNEPRNLQNLCLICNQVKNKWSLKPGQIERPPFDGDAETCRRGHRRSGNEYVSGGKRSCKSCHKLSVQQYRARLTEGSVAA